MIHLMKAEDIWNPMLRLPIFYFSSKAIVTFCTELFPAQYSVENQMHIQYLCPLLQTVNKYFLCWLELPSHISNGGIKFLHQYHIRISLNPTLPSHNVKPRLMEHFLTLPMAIHCIFNTYQHTFRYHALTEDWECLESQTNFVKFISLGVRQLWLFYPSPPPIIQISPVSWGSNGHKTSLPHFPDCK